MSSAELAELLARLPLWYFVFLFSVTLHEAAHAWVARLGGDDTAYVGGQVSLNPAPHIQRSPFGMVAIPILTFFLQGGQWMIGWASAPYDPEWANRHPWRSVVMALAGPASGWLLVFVSGIALWIGLYFGFFSLTFGVSFVEDVISGTGPFTNAVGRLLMLMFYLNLILGVFNLLPVPPLDGSEVWYLFVPSYAKRRELRALAQQWWILGLLVAWRIFPKVFYWVANLALRFLVSAETLRDVPT